MKLREGNVFSRVSVCSWGSPVTITHVALELDHSPSPGPRFVCGGPLRPLPMMHRNSTTPHPQAPGHRIPLHRVLPPASNNRLSRLQNSFQLFIWGTDDLVGIELQSVQAGCYHTTQMLSQGRMFENN